MRKTFKTGSIYLLLIGAALILYFGFYGAVNAPKELKPSDMIKKVEADQITQIHIKDNTLYSLDKNNESWQTYMPIDLRAYFGKMLFDRIRANKLELVASKPQGRSILIELLPMILTIILFAGFWYFFIAGSSGGNKAMSFGKSKMKRHKPDESKKITFSDVAGLKEEKQELEEIVDFLKSPKKYMKLGARIPKGILMVGRPGTGKTYLSRAVAGEAGVPFFTISGSDFVEMFVGVGASRVREMFTTAKKNSPCLIFIDEIDAVGRKRGAGLGGGHDEKEQTLNQLLVEMDGFNENEGIIIMAATNRPDILDPALLRPGRFDREVFVNLPDVKAREEIILVHARNKPIGENVDFSRIAKETMGFTPADLENLMNEAAILSARKKENLINMETLEEAFTKVIMGVEKKSKVVSEKERKITAYHEAGHAIIGRILSPDDPVNQVTIIPRGRAGGFTLQIPNEERMYESKTDMEDDLAMTLGGRIAEKLIFNEITTGASGDLKRVSEVARAMVTEYAMSDDLPAMSFDSEGNEVFLGKSMGHVKQYSEQVQAEIDRAVRQIVDTAYHRAETILKENLEPLKRVAEALLEFETIYHEEFEAAFSHSVEKLRELREENENKKNEAMKEREKKLKKKEEEEKRKRAEEEEKLRQIIKEKMQAEDKEEAKSKKGKAIKEEIEKIEESKDDNSNEDS